MTEPHHDFAGLVARYQGAVCAVAYSVLRDRARSEEVAQDAFLIAWQKLPGMDPAPVLPGWVCGIARNLARNAARRRKETEMITEPVAHSTPLDSLLDRESEQLARDALARLGDRERDAVVMYYRGDQSLREVATALGISEAAAKKRVLRGREHLRAALGAVESSLRATRPGPAFTAGCVAALAAGGAARASAAATAGSATAPASASRSASPLRAVLALPIAALLVGGVWAVDRVAGSSPAPAHAAAAELGRATPDWDGYSRPIDPAARQALVARIAAARSARIAAAPAVGTAAAPATGSDPAPAPADRIRTYDFAGSALLDPPPPPAPRAPGPIGKRDLRAAIQSVQPMLAECYRNAEPTLARKDGTITVVIRLEGEPEVGTVVTSARVEGDAHLAGVAELAECFRETLLAIELPGLEEPGMIDVYYPLTIP